MRDPAWPPFLAGVIVGVLFVAPIIWALLK
jgi:hypothetical protein